MPAESADTTPMKDQVTTCRHCGNRTPHKICHRLTVDQPLISSDGEEVGMADSYYFLAQCSTCEEVSLFVNWEHDEHPYRLDYSTVLYPSEKDLADSMPQALATGYLEAKKSKKLAPRAFVIMIRSALEYLCKDQGATKGNLYEKIEHLATAKKIPATLAEMAHAIRLVANAGAHELEEKISPEDAEALDEFFIALVEYVYVAPKKLQTLTERIKKRHEKPAKA